MEHIEDLCDDIAMLETFSAFYDPSASPDEIFEKFEDVQDKLEYAREVYTYAHSKMLTAPSESELEISQLFGTVSLISTKRTRREVEYSREYYEDMLPAVKTCITQLEEILDKLCQMYSLIPRDFAPRQCHDEVVDKRTRF